MTFEEAKDVFLNRGWIPVENGTIFDANKWRESVAVISKWLEQEPKPMIEIDLDYVIKQKYIEREVLDKIKAEIKEWYWQVDKQALAKDPCVVDAMIDLFIRTIDKYKAESK